MGKASNLDAYVQNVERAVKVDDETNNISLMVPVRCCRDSRCDSSVALMLRTGALKSLDGRP